MFTAERVDIFLFSWSLVYSLECYSLLNLCFQNRQSVESAWCSHLQFRYLNECGQGLSFLVSNLRGLILLLALQHYTNWQWWMVWCEPLHLTYLDPWIWHIPAECSHFQQFLHYGTPGFIFAPYTVAMKLPMLNCLLMIDFAVELFCMSQISIQMIVISDFGDTLIILGLEVRMISLKIWLFLRIFSTSSDVIQVFDWSTRYRIPTILR